MIAKVTRMNEFRRMMQRVLKNKKSEQLVILFLILLIAGLFFSRALLSFASLAMALPFVYHMKDIYRNKLLLLGIGLILLPVLITGIYSDDKVRWINSVLVKIPLLTLFLGLAYTRIPEKVWNNLILFYLVLVPIACCWSLWRYFSDPYTIQQSYLKAKVLATPADNDYVKFSWMVVTGFFLGIKLLGKMPFNRLYLAISCILVFLALYLHLLAAKTGLLCLYTGGLIYLFFICFIQKKWKLGVILFSCILIFTVFTYDLFPTLRNRVQYIVYDFGNYSKGHFLPGYNDAARWLSMKAGYAVMQENPIMGVGFGDIKTAVAAWDVKNYPTSYEYERFLPTNEWLVYGAGSGWPGMLLFSIGLALLLFLTTAKDPVSVILAVISCIPFVTDDSLEGQYGVILLAFIAFFGQQKFSKQEQSYEKPV